MSIAGIKLVHSIPGRVRVKIAQLRDNPEFAREIYQGLSGVRGIRRIKANPLTGSLLVLYDPEEMTALESLFALSEVVTPLFPGLDMAQIEEWLSQSGNGSGATAAQTSGIPPALGAPNAHVGKATGGIDLKLLLLVSLFVFGIRGLFVARQVPFPAWYDLWWFSFRTFFMLNRPEAQGMR
jgi:Heavy metal associated domain 2